MIKNIIMFVKSFSMPVSVMKSLFLSWIFLLFLSTQIQATEVPYNRIQVMEDTPTIDGTINSGEWPEEYAVNLSRQFNSEHAIRLYFAFNDTYLYLAAYVEDTKLLADGNGNGAGGYWETDNDDGIGWYFDIDNSRDNNLQDDDRLLALNIGNVNDPENGNGTVSRHVFNKGDNAGGSNTALDWGGEIPDDLEYVVKHYGTVNNSSDTDTGYSIEVALPWSSLLVSAPSDGETMGINVIIIFDDTGGTRDWSYNLNIDPASLRFTTPVRLDEYLEMRCGTQSGSQSGLTGPVNYQVMQFHRSNDATSPSSVGPLTTDGTRPYAVKLQWNSTGDNGSNGICSGFDIRYSQTEITTTNFDSATKWPLETYPDSSGSQMSTWVMGLNPETNYWFAIRAFDEADNDGDISIVGPVQTPSLADAGVLLTSNLYKGAVRVAPGGRYFMTEDGSNFIPIGHHFLLTDTATRYLYDAEIWTGVSQWTDTGLFNYADTDGASTRVTDYLDELQGKGVTVMRLWLEDPSWSVKDDGNLNSENGAYWIEFPRGNYNEAMGTFLKDLLRLCAERGIFLIITPFDTFFVEDDDIFDKTCWSTSNGGPLSTFNDFFRSADALQMCKDRWNWVITQVKASGYEDAIFGYEVLNEWDGTAFDEDTGGDYDHAFVAALAAYVRSLDDEHMIISSNSNIDPRNDYAVFSLYNDVIDATLPHFYYPATIVPSANPDSYLGTAVFQHHSQGTAWWTLNQLNNRPILNGEWGPADETVYSSSFNETDDETITRITWFTELCSGAAGPGLRLQGGVRSGSTYGLHLSDNMLGTQKTISAFVENGSKDPTFDFTHFPSENWKGRVSVQNTSAEVLVTASSDGTKGLAYLIQDQNETTGTVSGAILSIDEIDTSITGFDAEFWQTGPDQTSPAYTVSGCVSGNTVNFQVPDFTEEWAVKFYSSTETTSFSPEITANDSSGPVNITEGEQLAISISLAPESCTGVDADWYIVVNTPSGWQSFNVSQMDYSTSGLSASLQDYGLISFGPLKIFSTSSLSAGTYTYYFAVDVSGQLYYDRVTVTVDAVEVSAPTGFTASANGSTVTISWNAVSEAEGYNVYYGFSSGNYAGSVDLGNTTSRSFSNIADRTYYLAVTAYAGPSESSYSNEVSVTVNAQ